MQVKEKKCKGTNKAKGHGCGEPHIPSTTFQKGLCNKCWATWLRSTDEGNKILYRTIKTVKFTVEKEKKKKLREEKLEVNSSKAMHLADMYFSRYIRLFHSENGFCTCYTCGAIIPIKEAENGHYIKREHKSVRYHERNCRPQDKTCNGDIKHNGKPAEFRIHLVNEIGLSDVEELEELGRQIIKTSSRFYLDIADKYRVKVNEMQKKLGIKIW